ncbi:NADP-dependent oxidoreductase domain-containing protein [Gautieria morchelliformis]|nr:NADP-dependent oxidoreductase domain-containing protein [Gautieria morchelliformis]
MSKKPSRSLGNIWQSTTPIYIAPIGSINVPIEDTVTAMAELVKSVLAVPGLAPSHAVHPIAAVQVEYSPSTLDIENPDPKVGLLATARELGITVVAYSPLGRGLLAGKFTSHEDIAKDDHERRRFLPPFIVPFFKRHNATPGQICLAWLLALALWSKSVNYLEENANAANIKLTAGEVETIRKAAITSGAMEIPC